MKTIIKISLALATALGHAASAQRAMNDPTYSTHNYKHPNKAAYMKKQQDKQPVVYVEEVKDENAKQAEENNMTSSSNYKGMSAAKSKTKQFAVSSSLSVKSFFHASPSHNSNYKQQFPTRPRKSEENKEEDQKDVPVANVE